MNQKLRLYSNDFELSGYVNIKITNIDDLTKLKDYDNGELEELIIDNVIDYFPMDKAEDSLLKLSKLVKKGGKLIVIGYDLYEICKNFSSYNLTIAETNKLIFGDNPQLSKRLCFSTIAICNYLSEVVKFKILKKRINTFIYTIETERS